MQIVKAHRKTHIYFLTLYFILYLIDLQPLTKKLQNRGKKNTKKENNVSENYLPLQRFNKQMIVLQI